MNKTLLQRSMAVICLTLSLQLLSAQQVDLFKMQDSANAAEKTTGKEPVINTFYSTRLVNSQTVEMLGAGSMDFRIHHRFAPVNLGFYDMFGLDYASMRMGFDFGITKDFMAGIGRSTFGKEYDVFFKWRLMHQENGAGGKPLSIALAGSMAYKNLKLDPTLKVTDADRMYYTAQLLIGRKFSNNFSFQLSPTYTRYNRLIYLTGGSKDLFSVGFLARQKISRRISINAEYFLQTKKFDGMYDPLSVGVDINTGGHVFQLHFTNATGMNDHSFIHETSGSWGNGDIRWGFNISRIFTIGKRK
jgi:hypothetical protein